MSSINWQFRPNTQDEDIYKEVYVENCYRLPNDMIGITVIDVGANIGCFTVACLERGADYVVAYEPDFANQMQLREHLLQSKYKNVQDIGRFVVGDCWKSNLVYRETEDYQKHGDIDLTGAVNLFECKADPLDTSHLVIGADSIKSILGSVKGDRIWIKLDCEGAEYQILSSDLPWGRIERIFGECHDYRDGKFSRDTDPVEVGSDAFGGLEPEFTSLSQHLKNVGYSNIQWEYNPEDPHLTLFFADKTKQVCILTPFRNARRYLQLYFSQISNLKHALESEGYSLRLVAAEGDSLDNTRERIIELSGLYNIPLEIVDTTHGHMRWGSVEDPIRMKVMSDIMNKALDRVTENDDIVVWIMSDLRWDFDGLVSWIKHIDYCSTEPYNFVAGASTYRYDIVAPMVFIDGTKLFYDTWAYRAFGKRFTVEEPYYPEISVSTPRGCHSYRLDSAGTCLIMRGEVAKKCRASNMEAVSFCADAKSSGYNIDIDYSGWAVYHASQSSERILWIGDAVCVSGFARVSHNLFPILSEAGYEIDIIATNYQGTPHNYPYRIWPAGEDSGTYRAQQLIYYAEKQNAQYDAIIVLDDPWNVQRITLALKDLKENGNLEFIPPVIAWITVDGCNIKSIGNGFAHIVASTKFGADEILRACLEDEFTSDVSVIPFGVDTSIYRPLDKVESRRLVSSKDVPEDAFIVGTVSTNQLRKRLDLLLIYFAEWVTRYYADSAYLYLCLGAENSTGCDVLSLVRYYGLRKKVILNTSLLNEQTMAHVYNSFDVFVSLSQGEGFGLTALEAMACGVPTILSNWSGYGSWIPDDCAIKISCSSTALSSPLNSQAYVIGGVADGGQTVNALHRLYAFPDMRETLREKGLSLAESLSWKNSGDSLLDVLDKVVAQKNIDSMKKSI